MKLKIIVSLIAIGLTGCAGSPENRRTWEMKPVVEVHHGMADSMAFYQIGRSRQAQGLLDGAEAAYEKALAADPKNVDAMNALGALYAERGELERAALIYKRVADLLPKRAHLYNNIGYTLYLQGRNLEAIDAFRQAVTVDPGYERAWVNLQNVARKAGMADVAALAAQHALVQPSSMPTSLAKVEEAEDSVAVHAVVSEELKRQLTQLPNEDANPGTVVVEASHAAGPITMKEVDASASLNKVGKTAASQHQAIQLTEVWRIAPSATSTKRVSTADVKEAEEIVRDRGPAMLIKASMHGAASLASTPIPKARIEVSNGNGVNGFASRVRAQLKGDGFGVSRMTNFTQFTVRRTVIEYRGGFADAAMSLMNRLGHQVILREAKYERPGTDLRLILGTDRLVKNRVLSELHGGSPLVKTELDLENRFPS